MHGFIYSTRFSWVPTLSLVLYQVKSITSMSKTWPLSKKVHSLIRQLVMLSLDSSNFRIFCLILNRKLLLFNFIDFNFDILQLLEASFTCSLTILQIFENYSHAVLIWRVLLIKWMIPLFESLLSVLRIYVCLK